MISAKNTISFAHNHPTLLDYRCRCLLSISVFPGGWTNPLIVEWFADYARIAYSLFGDRVKTWITINEPIVICDLVYNTGIMAPRIKDEDGAFICNKNVLLAHAKAWRIYDEEFKPKYHGEFVYLFDICLFMA